MAWRGEETVRFAEASGAGGVPPGVDGGLLVRIRDVGTERGEERPGVEGPEVGAVAGVDGFSGVDDLARRRVTDDAI